MYNIFAEFHEILAEILSKSFIYPRNSEIESSYSSKIRHGKDELIYRLVDVTIEYDEIFPQIGIEVFFSLEFCFG